MKQELVLEYKQRPKLDDLQGWNRALPNESKADFEWTEPASGTIYQVKLPYWVKFAIERHYVHPGFALPDYMWGAVKGFQVDAKDVMRAGFNLITVANELGVGKTNLCLQFNGQMYGEPHAGEWSPDWDMALRYCVLNRGKILELWRKAKEMQATGLGKIRSILLDDIDSVFSKELWFEDRPLYIRLRKAVNLIRPRISNFLVSAPSLNDVLSILSQKTTFEVMPFPDQTYMVERYCRFVDQFSTTSNFFRKIMTEFSKFRLSDLPSSVYREYDEMRMTKEDEEMAGFEEAMEGKGKQTKIDEQPKRRTVNTFTLFCQECGYGWPAYKMPEVPRCPRKECRGYKVSRDSGANADAKPPE